MRSKKSHYSYQPAADAVGNKFSFRAEQLLYYFLLVGHDTCGRIRDQRGGDSISNKNKQTKKTMFNLCTLKEEQVECKNTV